MQDDTICAWSKKKKNICTQLYNNLHYALLCVFVCSITVENTKQSHACAHIQYVSMCVSSSDYLFKLLLIGDSGVGKSCLLLRFAVGLQKEHTHTHI